ncbi:MAG: hypothetical protein Q7K57_01570 [Burkholderiaceae bacterium]|nr:hypothetical protein [Burkholderiaceae bacterium]
MWISETALCNSKATLASLPTCRHPCVGPSFARRLFDRLLDAGPPPLAFETAYAISVVAVTSVGAALDRGRVSGRHAEHTPDAGGERHRQRAPEGDARDGEDG